MMKTNLKKLIDQFSIEIYIVDADTLQFLYVNEAGEHNTGFSLEELRKHNLSKLSPHATVTDLLKQMSVLNERPELKEITIGNMLTRKDGSRYPVDVKIQLINYEGQRAYMGLVQDASEKQLALDQLHYVLKGSSLGFWDWNIENNTYETDDHWLEILGYRRGEITITPRTAPDLTHPDDKDRINDAIYNFILYDDNFSLDFRARHKAGHYIWVRSSAAVVTRDLKSGNPLRVCGTHQDISKEKLDEKEREQFFNFFRMSSDLMMIGHLDGTLIKVNQATLDVLGYDEKEMLSIALLEWVHPEDRAITIQELKKQQDTGATINFENRCICKDGSYRWLSWRASFNAAEGLSYASARDITSDKQIQLALRQQQELYAALMANTEDVICHYDRDLRHTFVNQCTTNSWDMDVEEFIGKTRRELGFPNYLCDQWEQAMEQVFFTGEPASLIFDVENARGTARIYWNAFPGLIENGKVLTLFTVSRDISQYVKTEEELRKMHKLNSLGVLAGGIAHDFNNILTVLFGNIALAKSRIPNEHKSFASLEQAEKAFHRATHLTSQLLTFAKGGDPVKQDVSISSFIEEVVQFDLSGSNVKLEFQACDDLWMARVDKGQIAQVFSNLATNANQAMPNGGHLYISIDNVVIRPGQKPGLRQGKYLKFLIRDEGVGIDIADQEKIFDPYFTTKQQGSGLGLATVYSIISKHDGNISVKSTLDEGAVFTLYLPASDTTEQAVTNPPSHASNQSHQYSRILVMDDEDMICDLSAMYLGSIGYSVETAKNGEEAIALYSEALQEGQPFDCMIMDLTIPGGMSGKDALVEILKLHPQARAIVSSGYAADPVMANFEQYGFKGCITKPFPIATLQNEINKVLGDSTIQH